MSSTKSGKSACRRIFRSQAKLYWRREWRVGGVRGSAAGGRLAGGGFWGRSGSPLPSPGSDAERYAEGSGFGYVILLSLIHI